MHRLIQNLYKIFLCTNFNFFFSLSKNFYASLVLLVPTKLNQINHRKTFYCMFRCIIQFKMKEFNWILSNSWPAKFHAHTQGPVFLFLFVLHLYKKCCILFIYFNHFHNTNWFNYKLLERIFQIFVSKATIFRKTFISLLELPVCCSRFH